MRCFRLQDVPQELLNRGRAAEERAIRRGVSADDPNCRRVVSRFKNGAAHCEELLHRGETDRARGFLKGFGIDIRES